MGVVLFRLHLGNINSYRPGNTLTRFNAFKIYDGQIHAVEAFMGIMPENTPSGWLNYEVKKPKQAQIFTSVREISGMILVQSSFGVRSLLEASSSFTTAIPRCY
jgi:hypothetical protein